MPPPELADVSAYTEVGTGGAGPDIVGIRADMTPREVVEAIRNNPGLPYSHAFESVLAFRNVDSQQVAVDGGDFINFISAVNYVDQLAAARAGETIEGVTIAFTPAPGRGRVSGIHRHLTFAQAKRPVKATLEQSLTEKYGVPFWNDGAGTLMWSFDRQGKALKAPIEGFASVNEQFACVDWHTKGFATQGVSPAFSRSTGELTWGATPPQSNALRAQYVSQYMRMAGPNQWVSRCGAIMVKATIYAQGPLVNQLELRIAAPDSIPAAQAQAQALIDSARKADDARRVGAAQGNTPVL